MKFNLGFVIFCEIVSIVSLLLSGFVVLAHMKIPQLLKHPGQLIVAVCITQLLFDLHWSTALPATRSYVTPRICRDIAVVNSFWIFATWNIVTCLGIELIMKIKKPLSTEYSLRMKVYLIGSALLSAIEVFLVWLIGDFGLSNLETCAIAMNSSAEMLYFVIILGNLPILWASIIIVMNNTRHNKALRRLNYVVLSMTITWGMPTMSPLLRLIIGDYIMPFNYISMFLGCSSGIVIAVSRLASKDLYKKLQLVFLTKSSTKKQGRFTQRSSYKNEALIEEISLSNFFEDLTESTVKEILISLSLVCISSHCRTIHYSYAYKKLKYLFGIEDFFKLKQYIDMNIIKDQSFGIWEYQPDVFHNIRELCKIDNKDLIMSITNSKNFEMLQNFNKAGRSNAFIFNTFDDKFIIKTITQKEKYLMLDILERYQKRVTKHPESKIVRILGLYKLTSTKHCFIIMENIVHKKSEALFIFDLKGSMDNRYVEIKGDGKGSVLKDGNLYEMNKFVILEVGRRDKIVDALVSDAKFFRKLNIIDYSLLLAFYNKGEDGNSRYSVEGLENFTYSLGIIDFLQEYTLGKKLELCFKKAKGKVNTSVCSPNKYAKRFSSFIKQIFC